MPEANDLPINTALSNLQKVLLSQNQEKKKSVLKLMKKQFKEVQEIEEKSLSSASLKPANPFAQAKIGIVDYDEDELKAKLEALKQE